MPRPFDLEVGQRLREVRQDAGLSQERVAAALDIPRSAVSLIESGDRALASSELAKLSRVYGWSAEKLLFGAPTDEPVETLEEPEPVLRFFRTQSELAPLEERWLSQAEEQWRRYADLERLLYGQQRWDLPTYPVPGGRAYEQGERLAEQERRRLNLGVAPVRSMIGLLEGEGVKVLIRPFPDATGVSGAYFFSEALGPCVLVNASDLPSRRRFTEAHEYCHFLVDRQPLEGEICSESRHREEFEMRANAFAAAFLMPELGIRDALGEANVGPGNVGPEDVVHLMFRFGVSYQAILWRLVNLRFISAPERASLAAKHSPTELRKRLGYEYEPGQTEATPDRFRRLALEAWRAKRISTTQLAEMLDLPPRDLKKYFSASASPVRRTAKKLVAEPDWL
jgi:Zn-dependent peptidase ImmA (M78 family)/DNA-binding XRE family transcriptional regulator